MLWRRKRTDPPRFRRPSNSSGRMLTWWVLWRVPVFLLIVLAAWWYGIRPLTEDRGWTRITDTFTLCGDRDDPAAGCVVDGDTLIIGFGDNRRRIRLTGYDAPELDGECEAERRLGISARDALRDWLGEGPFEWDGADSPPRDQYGRELRAVRRVRGEGSPELLAETMIARGLAAESGWGAAPADWCKS